MATKGKKGDSESNPFSFKNFVSGGPQQTADFVSDEEEEEKPFRDVPPAAVAAKPKSKSKAAKVKKVSSKPTKQASVVDLFAEAGDPLTVPGASDDPAIVAVKKGTAGDDKSNPFSFTSFVQRDPPPPAPLLPKKASGDHGSSEDDWENSSCELSSAPLPSRPSATTGIQPSRNIFSTSDDDDADDDDDDDDDDVTASSRRGSVPVTLPAAVLADTTAGSGTEKLLRQLEKLQEENQRLIAQLSMSEEKAVMEKKRCQKLKKQLEVQQKREREETAALEQAVQMVERNLETSTIRAVAAEKKAEKLKQQLLAAQAHAGSDQLHAQHALQLTAIREKGDQASAKLMSAAQNAEKSVRELIGGVENLKFVAELLSTIDRFAEVPPDAD